MKRFGIAATLVAAIVLVAAAAKLAPSEQVWLHWDINSCLGLPGGPTPDQLATLKPPIRSAEEIEILKVAEKVACLRYQKVSALHNAAAIGGETEKFAAAGYVLSTAQARLAWANDDAAGTLARLEQAVKFAEMWAKAAQAGYDAGKVIFLEVLEAAEANTAARLAYERVRHALKRMDRDLSAIPDKPQIDVKDPQARDCTR